MRLRNQSRPAWLPLLALCALGLTACSALTEPDAITVQKEPPPAPPAPAAADIAGAKLGGAEPAQPSRPRPAKAPGSG